MVVKCGRVCGEDYEIKLEERKREQHGLRDFFSLQISANNQCYILVASVWNNFLWKERHHGNLSYQNYFLLKE